MYRELALKTKATLRIDGDDYDVDYFGMDDGRSEDATDALRFLFQLGRGYMIHLYVIQAGARADPTWFFHTTWIKDCAVMEVEQEDTGAPSSVDSEVIFLPRLHGSVEVGPRRYDILTQTFRASGESLEMNFAFAGGALRWTRANRWELVEGGSKRPLEASEWPQFTP
jgi:hypothetical protein